MRMLGRERKAVRQMMAAFGVERTDVQCAALQALEHLDTDRQGCTVSSHTRLSTGSDGSWEQTSACTASCVDGTLGCATPCLLCQKELLRFDMRVHVSQTPTLWFSGRLSDLDAPLSQLTGMQRRSFSTKASQYLHPKPSSMRL